MIQTILKQPLFWFFVYCLILSLISFAQFGIDKRRAIRQQWRIPESRLLLTAILGGSPGAILGMRVFHHKTLHRKFSIGLPVILLLQIALVAGIVWYRAG